MFTMPIGLLRKSGIANPLALSGCGVWLRSDLGITLGTGSAVSTWANQGTLSTAADATQSTGGSRPVWAASGGLNNQALITFDGSKIMNWAYAGSGAKTVMIVLKLRGAGGGGQTVIETVGSALVSEMIVDLAGYSPVSYIDDIGFGVSSNMVGNNDTLGTTNGHVVIHTATALAVNTTGNYTANYDGVTKTVVTSGAYSDSPAGSHIGARVGLFGLNADLYEIVIYNRVLSAGEIALLAAYARARYAI